MLFLLMFLFISLLDFLLLALPALLAAFVSAAPCVAAEASAWSSFSAAACVAFSADCE